MPFTSIIFFFCFLPIVLLLYNILQGRLKNVFILFASLLFYSFGSKGTLWLLIVGIVVNYCAALLISELKERLKSRRIVLAIAVLANVSSLFYFKYAMWTLTSMNNWFGLHLNVPNIMLPLGISFFMLRALSYVLDVYYGKCNVNTNIINVAVYISFFPQLISGPIAKYTEFEGTFAPINRKVKMELFADGVWLFAVGIAKKIIISNNIAGIVDLMFDASSVERTIVFAWAGAVGYCIQLYFDFSGYSDMAEGLSKMFGYQCPKNFNYPYISRSVSEFWRRWHMSLSFWVRDYIYIPLGGNRKGMSRKFLNIAIVWALMGIWHGAGLKYLLWGALWFAFIALENLLNVKNSNCISMPKLIFKHIYVILVSIFAWVIFKAESTSAALGYIASMLGLSGNTLTSGTREFILRNWLVYALGVVFLLPVAPKVRELMDKHKFSMNCALIVKPIVAAVLLVISLSGVVAG